MSLKRKYLIFITFTLDFRYKLKDLKNLSNKSENALIGLKNQLKTKFKKLKKSKNPIAELVYTTTKFAWIFLISLIKPSIRNARLGKLKHQQRYFQESTYTSLNRYPFLFKLCQQYFDKNYNDIVSGPKKILSFGCSTGEEIYTLGQLFPNAQIVGVDINNWCIEEAIRRYSTDSKFVFLNSQSGEFEQERNFDAIFCLAVLQHTKNRKQPLSKKATSFTFQQFEAIINELDSKLKPSGLLVIDQTDFRFLDTSISRKYRIYEVARNKIKRKTRRTYNKNNQFVKNDYFEHRIFFKTYN